MTGGGYFYNKRRFSESCNNVHGAQKKRRKIFEQLEPLHAQIGRAHFFAGKQVGGSVTHDYAAIFHNVAVVGDA